MTKKMSTLALVLAALAATPSFAAEAAENKEAEMAVDAEKNAQQQEPEAEQKSAH